MACEMTDVGIDQLLDGLRRFDALRDGADGGRGDKVFLSSLQRCPPEYAPQDYLDVFPSILRDALEAQGISRLYAHQAEAIELIRSGADVVLEAPTASGKTHCFNIPMIEMLQTNRDARAIMIHPMKALSNDQRRQFHDLAMSLADKGGRRIESWIFDGDTDREHRQAIKMSPPEVLLTNPEMLHQSFLGWCDQWTGFLRSIRLIIIDEIHEYRGYFGTNVALLLRRFLAKLHQLGARPQLVLATATCGNAEEHAYHLTGRRCTLVRASTAMRPERHFAFIEPDIPDFHFHNVYRIRIARAALACVADGLTALVFCPSRRFAEDAAILATRDSEELGVDPDTVAPYRSGYDAELRRQIEDGLRDGRYRAVFCTNALEIGVDIGRLDACILAGFPDSVLSAWQRIGRTGRSWEKTAYVLFYAFNNPFDRFFANNMEAFINKPLDKIIIGVDNEELMRKHLPYLVYETRGELTDELRDELGSPFLEFARKQTAGTKPVHGHSPPYNSLSIRGGSGATYKLMYKNKEIGTMSDHHVFREAYVGAIYNHFGRPYQVLAHGADEVHLEDAEPYLRTEGVFWTVTQTSEILAGRRYKGQLATCYGRLTVFENFGGYRLIDVRSDTVVNKEQSALARPLNVRGFWIELADPSVLGTDHAPADLFGVEQLVRVGSPFVIPCDRHDLGTLTRLEAPASVYLYETVPGGIGVAEKALDVWQEVMDSGIRIAEVCGCRNGCPSCLVPPRMPPGLDEPRKMPAIALAQRLLRISEGPPEERFSPSLHSWETVR